MRARILVVDDDQDILLGLENRLTWMGHEPLTADKGDEGLRVIQRDEPDLVLLDIQLPGLSGFDILQQLREKTDKDRAGIDPATVGMGPTDPPSSCSPRSERSSWLCRPCNWVPSTS